MGETYKELPVIAFATDAAWETWLRTNGEHATGVWMKVGKKGNPEPSITRTEAVRTALCWGWIDGQVASYDELWYLQRYTRRGPKSIWSQVNVDHVAELTAAGRMQPAGQAHVDAAKSDGRWDAAYAPPSKMETPPELQAALDASPKAAEAFAALSKSVRYSLCHRIATAKKAETKARNAAKFVDMLERGETF